MDKNGFFLIDELTRKALLEYLATKPYQEVVQGIAALINLKPLEQFLSETEVAGPG